MIILFKLTINCIISSIYSFFCKIFSTKKPTKVEVPEEKGEDQGSGLVTETLAKVYIRQKHYKKAIQAYEILMLKYPEKSSFFASQISEIKKLANSK